MRTVCLKNFDYASKTHKGLVRKHNEDFLAYFDTINGHVFVLCDGMGGHNAGDVASEMATQAVEKYFNIKYYANPFDAVEEAIKFANHLVFTHALGNSYLNGMGTTIVLALIRDDRVFYGHAGDSRLYIFRNQQLEQLTKDHSFVQDLLNKGLISEYDATYHPRRNEITRAVGLSKDFEPEVSSKAFIPNDDDVLLLCSDGLTNMVSDKEIAEILNCKCKINEKANKLVKQAKSYGGTDNISVQIIKFHNLVQFEDTKNYYKKKQNHFTNNEIIYFLAILVLLVWSFFAGINDNGTEINRQPKNNFTKKQFQLTEIIAYTPKKNDTWESLAHKFNISKSKLEELNPNIKHLDKAIHIKIPIKTIVVVTPADNIEWLSKKFKISEIDIQKANDINTKYLKVGLEIIIPLSPNNTLELGKAN